ncbi:MAG: TrbI/VirB10 family protein [Acidovorax sp.]|nr:TrbI/VirB10 family protein [Acidovorax sp.]
MATDHSEELNMPIDPAPSGAPGRPPAAKVPPESMALRAQPRPVTRLNRRSLALLAGLLALGVLGATVWSLQPKTRRESSEPAELFNVDRVSRSEGLGQLPADYSKLQPPAPAPVPELGPPLPGDLGPAIVKSQQPVVPSYSPPGHDPAASERDARRKESEQAAAASVFFRNGSQRAATAAPTAAAHGTPSSVPSGLTGFDPMAAGPASTPAQAGGDATTSQNRQDQKEAFQKTASTETRNSGSLQLPASPYQVMAGTVIAGALVTGIQSDLPGDVIATVTEPVYDTATGKHLLIPQGSRILGRYNSQVTYGQSRVQVVWSRVILPDTSSLTLGNLVGSDPAGRAGLEDGVDWHWDRVFSGAALTSLLGIGAELAAPENSQDGNRIVIAGRDSLQDSVNQIGQEVTRRNLNIQPTLTARPGLPMRVIVNRDLVLRPYQPLFFVRGTPR